jgi:hypothetical protein
VAATKVTSSYMMSYLAIVRALAVPGDRTCAFIPRGYCLKMSATMATGCRLVTAIDGEQPRGAAC